MPALNQLFFSMFLSGGHSAKASFGWLYRCHQVGPRELADQLAHVKPSRSWASGSVRPAAGVTERLGGFAPSRNSSASSPGCCRCLPKPSLCPLARGVPRKGLPVCSQPWVLWTPSKRAERARCRAGGKRSVGWGAGEAWGVLRMSWWPKRWCKAVGSICLACSEGCCVRLGCRTRTCTASSAVPVSKAGVCEAKPAASVFVVQSAEGREGLRNRISCSAAARRLLFANGPVSLPWVSTLFLLLITPLLLILASQNHSMAGVGRALCGSPSPTPCPSRVIQSRLHSTTSRRVLNISREGDSTASLGSLFQSMGKRSGGELCLPFLPPCPGGFPKGMGMSGWRSARGTCPQPRAAHSAGCELAPAWCGGCPDL